VQHRPLPFAADGAADADFARESLRGAMPHLFRPNPDDPARPEKTAAAIALSWRLLDAFAGQLGRRWTGPQALTWHERALFTVFALRMAQATDKADALVRRLAELWREVPLAAQPAQRAPYPEHWRRRAENERVMRARFDGLISRDEMLAAAIGKVLARESSALHPALRIGGMHGYEAPAMISLYACAKRRSGVFPSAQFLWLKLCNRSLWYALNSHGRRTPHPEGAGAIAHWRAECAFGRALDEPYLCEAVRGMFDYYASNRRQEVAGMAVPAWAQDGFFRAEA
jgi:intracellular multiplication protein IcmP